jgi:hypothetical protein
VLKIYIHTRTHTYTLGLSGNMNTIVGSEVFTAVIMRGAVFYELQGV